MDDGCLFCGIVAGVVPSVMVAADDKVCAFMDIDPGSDGHLLVVPRRHSSDLFDISADDLTATTLAAQRVAKVAIVELGADGVNVLNCSGPSAWQTVFHFHLHVIPRYADKARDRMTLPFKPGMLADTAIITGLGHRLAARLNEIRQPDCQ